MGVCAMALHVACGDHKTTYGSKFSPSTARVLGIEFIGLPCICVCVFQDKWQFQVKLLMMLGIQPMPTIGNENPLQSIDKVAREFCGPSKAGTMALNSMEEVI